MARLKVQEAPSGDAPLYEEELDSVIDYGDSIADTDAPIPLPVGVYIAEIREVRQRLSSKGKRYAEITFYIDVDQYPPDFPIEESPDGVTVRFRRLSLEDNKMSRWNVKRFCMNLGAPMPGRKLDLSTWVGRKAKVTIKHEEWEGDPRAVISNVAAT